MTDKRLTFYADIWPGILDQSYSVITASTIPNYRSFAPPAKRIAFTVVIPQHIWDATQGVDERITDVQAKLENNDND